MNYDIKNLMKIARFLNNDNHKNIHVLNRAQMIDDAYHFLMESSLTYGTFTSLLSYLSKETNFIVRHSVMNVLQYMSPLLHFPESENFKVRSDRKKKISSLYV